MSNLRIDKLKYNFDQGARPNRYAVDIRCAALGIQMEAIRCVSATLPGKQLETSEASEYGPARKMPYGVTMDGGEASFTFLCDSSFADRFLIETWQSFIYGQDDLENEVLTTVQLLPRLRRSSRNSNTYTTRQEITRLQIT